jgi:uncharacterized hydrophobic protein (TIGR00271 family)
VDYRQTLKSPPVLRGLLSILAAVLVLAFPNLLKESIWVLASLGAIVVGLVEILTWWRDGRSDHQELLKAAVLIAGGAALILFREETVRTAEFIFAGILLARSLLRIYRAIHGWRQDAQDPFWDLIRATVGLLLAATLIVIPASVISMILILLALGWIGAGLVVLVYAIGDDDPSIPAPSDIVGVLREKTMKPDERRFITETIFESTDNEGGTIRFIALMSFATAIAAFGVEADSTAVVIGAMLIAPLMSPIMALAAGLLMGWAGRVNRSGWLVVLGVAIGIGGSFLMALISPAIIEITQNSQVLSRTTPTLLDLLIALAAGAAGAYAVTHPKVSNSLPGVAIAVALAPPLAVVGVSLESGEFGFAGGAFLLFLTNLVGIVVAAGIVYVLSGYSPWFWVEKGSDQRRKSFALVGLSLMLVALPLAIIGDDLLDEATRNTTAEATVDSWLGSDTPFDVVSVQVRGSDIGVTILGPDDPPDPDDLASELSIALDREVDLALRVVPEETFEVSTDPNGTVLDESGP